MSSSSLIKSYKIFLLNINWVYKRFSFCSLFSFQYLESVGCIHYSWSFIWKKKKWWTYFKKKKNSWFFSLKKICFFRHLFHFSSCICNKNIRCLVYSMFDALQNHMLFICMCMPFLFIFFVRVFIRCCIVD